MDDVGYAYAAGDRLARPDDYFYPPVLGPAFLAAWQADRRARTAGARIATSGLARPIGGVVDPGQWGDTVGAGVLVTWVAAVLTQSPPDAADRARAEAWFAVLHTKIEVGKRLYASYDAAPPHRPSQPELAPLETQVLMAELLEHQHAVTGDVRYVNALVKLLDGLTSVAGRMDDDLLGRVARLADRERECIAELLDHAVLRMST